MASITAEEFFSKGLEAFHHGHLYLAKVCFENAVKEERTPRYCSYLGVTLASSRGDFSEAIALGKESIAGEPARSDHYLNLGRIYLLAGMKTDALATFRAGLQQERNQEIERELQALGIRKPPVFPSLPRNHPLNRYLGKLLSRLGLRGNKE